MNISELSIRRPVLATVLTIIILPVSYTHLLGGTPYRDGSFEYYISEKMRDNDAKATGPFIMGCLQLGK